MIDYHITELKENEIFVFGSNLSGMHRSAAANDAMKFGAQWGNPVGLQGKTYAIPTKTLFYKETLPLKEISKYVLEFIEFTKAHKDLTFLVTEVGCGLAGLTPTQVAPFFKGALECENIELPKRFLEVLLRGVDE
jgi:hypothetical protein